MGLRQRRVLSSGPPPARWVVTILGTLGLFLLAADGCSNPAMSPEAECLEREHAEGDKTWQEAREACPVGP